MTIVSDGNEIYDECLYLVRSTVGKENSHTVSQNIKKNILARIIYINIAPFT